MCCDTKIKIAATVRELLQTRPITKITVQDVMQRADMTRQSFYYHFQDIYDVLEWDVSREFREKLVYRSDQPFECWCRDVIIRMKDNQSLYRKMAEALGRGKLQELSLPYTRPQMERLLYGTVVEEDLLSADEQIALDFASRTLVDSFLTLMFSHNKIDTDACIHNICAIVNILQGRDECHAHTVKRRVAAC